VKQRQFAKIVEATDGAEVLFYMANGSADSDIPVLKIVTEAADHTSLEMEMEFDETEKRQAAFDGAGVEFADKIRDQLREALGE